MSHPPRTRSLTEVCEEMLSAGEELEPLFWAGREILEAMMTSYELTIARRFFGGAVAGPGARRRVRELLAASTDERLVELLRAYFNGRHRAKAYIQTPYVDAAIRLLTGAGC